MSAPRFRVYWGPDEVSSTALRETTAAVRTVRVPLADLLEVLRDAVANRRAWVDDFTEDEVAISRDLYDVLMAYRSLRRPSA